MFNIMMRFKVVDYDRWKAQFDADEPWRRVSGERDYHIYRDADDPLMITVRLGWDSMDTGQMFISSDRLRRQMDAGGVVGEPTYYMINDVMPKAA